LPGVAPVAKQQGAYLARLIKARLKGGDLPPFRYRDFGSLATIGRKSAVVEIGRFRVTGFVAWLIWSIAHIYFLIGFRNRLAVAFNWGWNYVTFQRGTRLITGLTGSRMSPMEAVEAEAPNMIVSGAGAMPSSLPAGGRCADGDRDTRKSEETFR
jgi:NADH dehydrogenase